MARQLTGCADGHRDCRPIVSKIVEKIKITITLIEKIVIHGCNVTVTINICVQIIVQIIVVRLLTRGDYIVPIISVLLQILVYLQWTSQVQL